MARECFRLEIPGKPVPKDRPRATVAGGHVRFYTPAATRAYEKRVRDVAQAKMTNDGWRMASVALVCELYFFVLRPKSCPKSRAYPSVKPDLDNYVKAVLDGMNGVVFADDNLLVDIHARKCYTDDEPRTLVCIRPAVLPWDSEAEVADG